jgi:hypothetical protein
VSSESLQSGNRFNRSPKRRKLVMRLGFVHFRADAVTSGSLFTAARNVASSSVV